LSKACLFFHATRNKGGLRQAQPKAGWGLVVILATLATPAHARDNLGVFGRWAAFRDMRPPRCYAIAEPVRAVPKSARWRPFASVATWPGRARNQVHIRLRQPRPAGARVLLQVGRQRFPLVVGGADAWAPDARTDAAIVAAMRSAERLYVGGDAYTLRGAATAIDAALLGCVRR
jgi:hypothetical protein